MRRRRHKTQVWNPRAYAGGHASACRALVLVDGSAIRRKIKRDHEKALRDLENARRQLDHFHQVDFPEFTRWINGNFGAMLTEIRELHQKLAANQALIFEVESQMFFGCSSYARAYQRVMQARENPSAAAESPNGAPSEGPQDSPDGASSGAGDCDDDPNRQRTPLEEVLDEVFSQFGSNEGRDEDPDSWGERPPAPKARPAGSLRLKDLYRRLVRLLHPDVQEEMTPQKTEWWHQTQAAYTAGDADQLEIILTLCETDATGAVGVTSASLLLRLTAQLQSTLRQIKLQLRELRHDLAWEFSSHQDHDPLAARVQRELAGELQPMREDWRATEELLARWKAQAEKLETSQKSRPTTTRKKRPLNRLPEEMDLPF